MSTRRPPPTIRDVAALAGVSAAAVSRYVNARQRFTPEVEARIARAIADSGWRSNPAARSIATGRSGAVAVLVAGVDRPHAAALVKGIGRAALASGHDLLIVDTAQGEAPEREVQRVMAMQVDGLLIAAPMPAGTAERLVRYGRPFVDLTRTPREAAHREQAGELLGHYLLRGAHRRIAYLAGADDAGSALVLQGLRRALQADGLSPQVLTLPEADADGGAALAGSLLLSASAPDAVVACNDLVAMGFAGEAQRLGVLVPAELSVAGVGNMPLAAFLQPALTSVELHLEQAGEAALWQLLAAIRGDAVDAPATPANPAPPGPRLIVRESTRARRAG